MEQQGLKSTHISCIYYLHKNEMPLTAVELCAACEEDKAAISRAVTFLESKGYLMRDSKNDKAYRSRLFLTEKGKAAGKFVSDRIEEFLAGASEGLSDGDREIMYKSLRLISDNLDKIVNGIENFGK